MVKTYFSDIEHHILVELLNSTKSIKLAVAWFTNDVLYKTILNKISLGVKVDIILNHDEINCNDEKLDFNLFLEKGGTLFWVDPTKKLMHHKFCIIDDKIVINGSFNWTSKAVFGNSENIQIFDELMVANDFCKQFEELKISAQKINRQPKQKSIVTPAQSNELDSVSYYSSKKRNTKHLSEHQIRNLKKMAVEEYEDALKRWKNDLQLEEDFRSYPCIYKNVDDAFYYLVSKTEIPSQHNDLNDNIIWPNHHIYEEYKCFIIDVVKGRRKALSAGSNILILQCLQKEEWFFVCMEYYTGIITYIP